MYCCSSKYFIVESLDNEIASFFSPKIGSVLFSIRNFDLRQFKVNANRLLLKKIEHSEKSYEEK